MLHEDNKKFNVLTNEKCFYILTRICCFRLNTLLLLLLFFFLLENQNNMLKIGYYTKFMN